VVEYRVIVKPSADKELRRLPLDVQRRIVSVMRALATNPRPPGVVKMQGGDNLWRIRLGLYRIIYEIHDERILILVLRIAHRKDVYR
jgi:mRNA interferase RelE/StbE